MEYQPTIYCFSNLEPFIMKDFFISSFWTLKKEYTDDVDVSLEYKGGVICVKGLEQAFELGECIRTVLNKISPYNLSYIENLFDNETERSEVLELASIELKKNLQELILAVNGKKANAVKLSAHKLHSKLLVLSIPVTEACRSIEEEAQDLESPSFKNNYYLLKMHCLIRLWQIDINKAELGV